jgi:4-hydroxy-tetrahydrodipicolinate reductase
MTKIIIIGSKGRMGQTLLACSARFPEIEIAGQIDAGDDPGAVIDKCDAVIDFSFHNATLEVARLCARRRKALVIGTTGHADAEKSAIRALQTDIPMVWSSNYSTGVNTLFWLTRKAAAISTVTPSPRSWQAPITPMSASSWTRPPAAASASAPWTTS